MNFKKLKLRSYLHNPTSMIGALCWQRPQGDRKIVPTLYPQICKIQMKTTIKVEGTNTHPNVMSLFLTACNFNYSVGHTLPAQLHPLTDIQPAVSKRTRYQDEWICKSNISHHSFKCYYSHDRLLIYGT